LGGYEGVFPRGEEKVCGKTKDPVKGKCRNCRPPDGEEGGAERRLGKGGESSRAVGVWRKAGGHEREKHKLKKGGRAAGRISL